MRKQLQIYKNYRIKDKFIPEGGIYKGKTMYVRSIQPLTLTPLGEEFAPLLSNDKSFVERILTTLESLYPDRFSIEKVEN